MKPVFKNFLFWVFLAIIALSGSLIVIHSKGIQIANEKMNEIEPLYARQIHLSRLSLSFENYRRTAMSFRKMANAEILGAKDRLKSEVAKNLAQLDHLSPDANDLQTSESIRQELDAFFRLSAKFEPMLFLKDAYQKPEVSKIHDDILGQISTMGASAGKRLTELKTSAHSSGRSMDDSTRILSVIVAGILFLVSLIFIRNYWVYLRPLRNLKKYALRAQAAIEESDLGPPKGLKSSHLEIANALRDSAGVLSGLRKERQKFIQDIVHDLRAPLEALQEGQSLFSKNASDSFQAGLCLLSGSLGDLEDVARLNTLHTKLNERTADLSELISDASKKLTIAHAAGNVQVSVPPLPIWVRLDADRFDRVLVQLLSKTAEVFSKKEEIHISASVGSTTFNGIEIIISGPNTRVASGPELDLMKHWIAQNGFGMTLAYKIVKAHGGTITASGVKGTSAKLFVRLPRSRVTDGLISPTDVTSVMGFEKAKPQPIQFSDLNSF